MSHVLLIIFLLIFIFSLPFPLFLKKPAEVIEINTLEALDIFIEEIENGISILEAWSVSRNGENFLEISGREISNLELRAIVKITKLSANSGIALGPLLRSYRSEILAKNELKNLIGIEAGSAKATTALLTFLPLLLITLAQSTGLDVMNTVRHSIPAQTSLVFAIALQLLGRHWARRIINAIE